MYKKENKNEIKKESTHNLSGSKFSNVGKLHIGDKINQEIHDNSINYEVDMEDIKNIETLSKYLTSHFNEKKITLWGVISVLIGILSVLSSIKTLLPSIFNYVWLPLLPGNLSFFLIGLGIILIALGFLILNALHYKHSTKCLKCKKEYAYKPSKPSTVRDVSTKEGLIKRKTTKYYKCRYCEDEIEGVSNETIDPSENNST